MSRYELERRFREISDRKAKLSCRHDIQIVTPDFLQKS